MPLTEGVAIVTAAQVAQITHEAGLANPDSGNATIADLLVQATTALILEVKHRGYNPAVVSNEGDMRHAAANWVAWKFHGSLPGDADGATEKADRYRRDWFDALGKLVIETTDARDNVTRTDRGLPRVSNWDAEPAIGRGTDNRTARYPAPTWITR